LSFNNAKRLHYLSTHTAQAPHNHNHYVRISKRI
jgi:hypothetical protein